MAFEVVIKKLGNSFGVILPKNLIEIFYLKENETVFIEIVKEAHLAKLFGSLKGKMSGQKFKDLVRKGW